MKLDRREFMKLLGIVPAAVAVAPVVVKGAEAVDEWNDELDADLLRDMEAMKEQCNRDKLPSIPFAGSDITMRIGAEQFPVLNVEANRSVEEVYPPTDGFRRFEPAGQATWSELTVELLVPNARCALAKATGAGLVSCEVIFNKDDMRWFFNAYVERFEPSQSFAGQFHCYVDLKVHGMMEVR